jgi:hypothetical protein
MLLIGNELACFWTKKSNKCSIWRKQFSYQFDVFVLQFVSGNMYYQKSAEKARDLSLLFMVVKYLVIISELDYIN